MPRFRLAWALAPLAHLALALLLLAAAPLPAAASVIGIDFGTDWSKTALVRSGAPLDIVLNTESKRKTPSVVLVRQGDRRYGSDAVALSTRFPQDNYPALKNLLGKLYDDPIAAAYRDTFANRMVRDPVRGTVSFTFNETTTFSVEELVAMQLAAAKKQAEDAGQEFVAGAVLTVPPYWGQFERRALLDAAELANLRVLALVSDETAVALNYASGRTFGAKPEHHIFYDMGAGSTVAALVRFQQATPAAAGAGKKASSSATSNVVELEVQAVGYDASLGGHSVDVKLQQHLAQEFTKKHGSKLSKNTHVANDHRAMAKLLREATRVKQILSANTDTFASVEGLIQDLDFRTKVTRAELEAMSTDLAARVAAPAQQVLKQANITLDDLDSLILVGGGARVPFVQAALADLVGERRIAKNVNADEAAVMGAAFRGAGLSAQFRVRQIKVKDVNMHPVEVAYDAEPKAESAAATRNFHTTFFSDKTVLGAKKLMTFKRQSDFEFALAYKGQDAKVPIVRAKVSGLATAIESKKDTALDAPKIKALIELTESGVIAISDAAAHFEVEQVDKEAPSLKDTVMNFFKGKKTDEKAGGNADGDVEEVKDELTAENVTLASAGTSAAAGNATAAPTKKIVTETVKLDLTLDWQTVKPYDAEMVAEAMIRLAALDASDAHRRKREEALNSLESFYYSGKQLLFSEHVELTSTQHERTTLQSAFDHVSEWLYDAADSAPLEELVAKLKNLKEAHAPAWFRHEEYKMRSGAVERFKGVVAGARERLASWKEDAERAVADAAAAAAGGGDDEKDGEETTDTNATTTAAEGAEDNNNANNAEGGETNTTTTTTTTPVTTTTKPKPKSFHHIPADLDALETLLTRTETWFAEKLAAQTKLAPHDTPALLTADLTARATKIEKELERLSGVAAKAAKRAAAAAAAAAKRQKEDVKKAGRNVEEETRKMAEGLKEKLRKATEEMKKEAAAAKDRVKGGAEKEQEEGNETTTSTPTAPAGDGVHEEL
ncbi:Hypoxia up-regulated protein 1 [Geranomyces variabilis]|uniref:Hypoxia up-regulated protein 1 n=1 Tax=Geranomyces variabilis TaxID=109894 RepID=A0AAD5TQY0_9FUNG|nr:Hypoxia up-regulated protein 1 [Geranomyces variabilis]